MTAYLVTSGDTLRSLVEKEVNRLGLTDIDVGELLDQTDIPIVNFEMAIADAPGSWAHDSGQALGTQTKRFAETAHQYLDLPLAENQEVDILYEASKNSLKILSHIIPPRVHFKDPTLDAIEGGLANTWSINPDQLPIVFYTELEISVDCKESYLQKMRRGKNIDEYSILGWGEGYTLSWGKKILLSTENPERLKSYCMHSTVGAEVTFKDKGIDVKFRIKNRDSITIFIGNDTLGKQRKVLQEMLQKQYTVLPPEVFGLFMSELAKKIP